MAKATAAEYGWTPLARRLILLQLTTAAIAGLLMLRLHLSFVGWDGEALPAIGIAISVALWLAFLIMPGKSASIESRVAEMLFVFILMMCMTLITLVAQYPAIAVGLPFSDAWLARADAALGVNVSALARWTTDHPAVGKLLAMSYRSYSGEFFLTILGLVIWQDRQALWELVLHYHVCLVVALLGVMLWPAAYPAVFYGFTPTIDMSHGIAQIAGLHAGSLREIAVRELDGLVSFPSFHTAGALIVSWAWRRQPIVFWPVAALNALVILSTFMTGVHYVMDVIAGIVLVVGSVAVFSSRIETFLAKWGAVARARMNPETATYRLQD